MSSRAEPTPKTLVAAVLALTVTVLGLGGAIVAIKLRPQPVPTTAIDRSIELWQRAVIADPENDDARVGLGMALLEAGRGNDARGAFEEAIGLNGDNWTALLQLGLLAAESDAEGAIEYFDRSIAAAPTENKAIPLVAKGDLLLRQDDAEGARIAYEQATVDMPFLLDAHFGLGRALEALGHEKGAMKAYKEALRFDPTNQVIAEAIAQLKGED